MRIIKTLIIVFFIVCIANNAMGQNETSIPRWKLLSRSYGFLLGQQAGFDFLIKNYPDLSSEAKIAKYKFDSSSLGLGAIGVKQELSELLGDDWDSFAIQLKLQNAETIKNNNVSRKEAVVFLQEVRDRASPGIFFPEEICATILSANTEFIKNPELEISRGWKQDFRTKNHPKAKGVDFTISYPITWSKREGYRPNIIQFFQSQSDYGLVNSSLMVIHIPGEVPTKDDYLEVFTSKDLVPQGGKFIKSQELLIENLPAGMLVCDIKMQRLDVEHIMRTTLFCIGMGNNMIQVQFGLTEMPGSGDTLATLQKKYMPLYREVMNSLIINDLYN
jgi:hypothetical protein